MFYQDEGRPPIPHSLHFSVLPGLSRLSVLIFCTIYTCLYSNISKVCQDCAGCLFCPTEPSTIFYNMYIPYTDYPMLSFLSNRRISLFLSVLLHFLSFLIDILPGLSRLSFLSSSYTRMKSIFLHNINITKYSQYPVYHNIFSEFPKKNTKIRMLMIIILLRQVE